MNHAIDAPTARHRLPIVCLICRNGTAVGTYCPLDRTYTPAALLVKQGTRKHRQAMTNTSSLSLTCNHHICLTCHNPFLGSSSRGKMGKHYPAYHCSNHGHYYRIPKQELKPLSVSLSKRYLSTPNSLTH